MSFERLTIKYETKQHDLGGKIEALFNPTQLTLVDRSSWQPSYPAKQGQETQVQQVHQYSPPKTLSVDLFFDAYERAIDSMLVSDPPPLAAGVLVYTEAVARLARVHRGLGRPPICELWWGKIPLLRGVLQEATQTLLLFREDGTPVRATVSCTFTEYAGETAQAATGIGGAATAHLHVVKKGDTLMSIAAERYGDFAEWRRIARANNIDDPRSLTPGQGLKIPGIT